MMKKRKRRKKREKRRRERKRWTTTKFSEEKTQNVKENSLDFCPFNQC